MFEFEVGIPTGEHYRLWRDEEKWAEMEKQAHEAGDKKRTFEYHLKRLKAGRKLARFVGSYIKKYHEKKGIR